MQHGVAILVAHGQTKKEQGTWAHAFSIRLVKSYLSVYVQHGDVVLVAIPPFLVLGVCNVNRIESMIYIGLDLCQHVLDLEFRIRGSGCSVQGAGFIVHNSWLRVEG